MERFRADLEETKNTSREKPQHTFLALFAVGVLGVWVNCCEDDAAVGVDTVGCCSSLGRCEVDEEGVTVDGGLEDDLLDGASMGGRIEGPGAPL